MSFCPICTLPAHVRREVDKDIIDHRLPWAEIAKAARCSRRVVTKHSKHLSEVLHEERKQAPLIINYAPNVRLCVLPQDDVGEAEGEGEV